MAKAKRTPSALPTHADIKKPLLALLRRKQEVSPGEAVAFVAKKFAVSETSRQRRQPCGKETVLQNRVRWARWELTRAGKVETSRRGYFRLATTEATVTKATGLAA
jgi:restriction system protein